MTDIRVISTQPAPVTTFRDQAAAISPTYLKGPWGTKWIYTHAIILDGIADGTAFAALAGNPSVAPTDGIPWLALDRQIDQGPNEPLTSFRVRLAQWLDLWRLAGSQRSVLLALASYFTPNGYTIETVNDSQLGSDVTAWDSSTAGADPPTHTLTTPHNWNWDGIYVAGRSWVIIFGGPWTQGPLIGGFTFGDGTVLGFTGGNPPNDAPSIRGLVAKWKSAGDYVAQIIIAFDATWYQPTDTLPSAKLPDGTWGPWGRRATETESTGPWGQASTLSEQYSQWGQVTEQQVAGPEGVVQFARVWSNRSTRTQTTASGVRGYEPRVSHSTTTATNAPSYTPTRPATSCFMGPVL
jgi:hypothetical protein